MIKPKKLTTLSPDRLCEILEKALEDELGSKVSLDMTLLEKKGFEFTEGGDTTTYKLSFDIANEMPPEF